MGSFTIFGVQMHTAGSQGRIIIVANSPDWINCSLVYSVVLILEGHYEKSENYQVSPTRQRLYGPWLPLRIRSTPKSMRCARKEEEKSFLFCDLGFLFSYTPIAHNPNFFSSSAMSVSRIRDNSLIHSTLTRVNDTFLPLFQSPKR